MTDYTMTNQEFICAAGSYFGLPGEQLMQGSKLETLDTGEIEVVLRIALKPDDMIGIGKRMEAMRDMSTSDNKHHGMDAMVRAASEEHDMRNERMFGEDEVTHAARQRYNVFSPSEKSKYGSFARYVHAERIAYLDQVASEGISGLKVSHIDAPQEEEPEDTPAFWLPSTELNEGQMLHYVDVMHHHDKPWEYLVPWSMLTEEQKSKYDKRYVGLSADQCSDEQKDGALDYDEETHQYAVPYRFLTEEQGQKAEHDSNVKKLAKAYGIDEAKEAKP